MTTPNLEYCNAVPFGFSNLQKKTENINLSPYLFDIFLKDLTEEVGKTLTIIMTELRKQAATRTSKQAERIRTGALSSYDYAICWNALRRHADDPWAFIESRLSEKYIPLSDDEHLHAIGSIAIGESWNIARKMLREWGGESV